jgi:SH3 domain protein
VRIGRLWILALAFLLATPEPASAEYVRDEIRINMRTGPGLQYRILKSLASGDRVSRLGATGDWIHVRTPEGVEGWVPSGYLSQAPPASLALPAARSELESARSTIGELEQRLAAQAASLGELEALRARAEELGTENLRLSVSTRWKDYLAGAGLLAVGVLVGLAIPRSGGARGRKIKL